MENLFLIVAIRAGNYRIAATERLETLEAAQIVCDRLNGKAAALNLKLQSPIRYVVVAPIEHAHIDRVLRDNRGVAWKDKPEDPDINF